MKCPICKDQLEENTITGYGFRKDILKCNKGHFRIESDIHTLSYRVGKDVVHIAVVEGMSGYNRLRKEVNKLVKKYKQPKKVRRLK